MDMSLEQLLEIIPRGSPDESLAREVNFDALPSHIAIIMDGNGRWAAQRHLPRVEGHRAGIESVRAAVETSARLGIGGLTLYAFSVENWKRPVTEVTVQVWRTVFHGEPLRANDRLIREVTFDVADGAVRRR